MAKTKNKGADPHRRMTRRQAAKAMQVSYEQIKKAGAVRRANTELSDKVLAGTVSLHAAYQARHKPKELVAQALAAAAGDIRAFPRELRKLEAAEVRTRTADFQVCEKCGKVKMTETVFRRLIDLALSQP